MSIEFPETWSALQYPHIRAELLVYLRDASSPDLWAMTSDLEFLVHFVFDDNDFGPAGLVTGKTILNIAEATAVASFVAELDKAIGPKSKALSKITQTEWEPVAGAARDALATLVRSGVPRYG